MPVHSSSYKNGMDRDSSKNKYQPDSYYKLRNMRVTSFEELSNGTIQTLKGNTLHIEYPQGYLNHVIIGWKVIRKYLIVWSTETNDDIGGKGTIWYTDLSISDTWHLVFESDDMLLTAKHPIFDEAIGFYEDETIVKVYWTDNFNMVRFIDIFHPPDAIDFSSGINIVSNVSLSAPKVINIGSGNLYVGRVQYAIQYYNIGGIETTLSSCTPLINLTQSNERLSGTNIRKYEGSKALDNSGNPNNSGKSVTIKLNNVDTNYDKVRVFSVLYRNLNQEPEIHVLGEYNIVEGLIVTDYGVYTKGTVSLNAFRTLGNSELYCKTISQKGNKALIGNITEKFFDIDFDARAYRYGPVEGTGLAKATIIYLDEVTDLDLLSCTNDALVFKPNTPAAISSYTDDEQGFSGVVTGLSIIYSDTIASGVHAISTSGQAYEGNSNWNITLTYVSDTTFGVLIDHFQTFAEQQLGVSDIRHITDSVDVEGNVNVHLEYVSAPWAYRTDDDVSTTGVPFYDHGADTFYFQITRSSGDFFINFDYFSYAQTTLDFAISYNYDEVVEYQYTTSDPADTNYTPTNVGITNPATWNFVVTKSSGLWFPTVVGFDPTNITTIVIYVSTYFIYTGVGDKHIIVYNSKTGLEETIHHNVDDPGCSWPDTTYSMHNILNGAYEDVPEDHDCINPYNYDFLFNGGLNPQIDEVATYCDIADFNANILNAGEPNNANQFKWMSDMTTIGGEGPNVKYEFCYHDMLIDESPSTRYDQPDIVTIENLSSYDSYKNPLVCASYCSYKHDEVYRMGLVLVNEKGQESFVKWIGDIKFPTVKEMNLATNDERNVTARVIGIKFTVNTDGLYEQGIRKIKIVRVERKEQDRSIYSQGALSAMVEDTNLAVDYVYALPRIHIKTPALGVSANMTMTRKVLQFISPEVNYFKDIAPDNTHYIKYVARIGSAGGRYSYISYDLDDPTKESDMLATVYETTYLFDNYWNQILNVNKYVSTKELTTLNTYNVSEGIVAGIVEKLGETVNQIVFDGSITGLPIVNRALDRWNFVADPSLMHSGPSGTCLILGFEDEIDYSQLTNSIDYSETFLVDYKIPGNAASQYGGLNYESRQSNTYIECGHEITVDGVTLEPNEDVYGGDTYIGLFEHQKTLWEADDNDGDGDYDVTHNTRIAVTEIFPCESVINFDIGHGEEYSKSYNEDYIYALREDADTYDADIDHDTITPPELLFIQKKNMYEYNSVYSQQNLGKIYFQKPDNWLDTVHDDTLVKISLEKTVREEVDSFIRFLTDNEKLLPTEYGAINDLFAFKNYIIVFMDHAFGTLSIDERALLPIQNNSILELGAGNNLQFFDFISNKSGSVHPQSISYAGNGFLWFDAYLHSIGYYNGETRDLGLTKGMSSTIKAHTDLLLNSEGTFYNNQFAGGNVLSCENKKFKETLISFNYSELAQLDMVFLSSVNTITFILSYPLGNYNNINVVINGKEYIADITDNISTGILSIDTIDNPGLNAALSEWPDGNYYIYFSDLSKTYSFSSINNAFQFEYPLFPTWMIEYNEDLFDVLGHFNIYKENYGNYGEFYGKYRNSEIEYLINPGLSTICLYNNYEYSMELLGSDGTNQLDESWDSVKIFNDYQWSASYGIRCAFFSGINVISRTDGLGHGLTTGDEIMLSGNTLPTLVDNRTKYYAIVINANQFQISETRFGTEIALENTTGMYHTLDIPLSEIVSVVNDKRRFRAWRMKDQRDWKNYIEGVFRPRIRDSYVRLGFKYLNNANKKMIMHDLNTFYTITRESYSKL